MSLKTRKPQASLSEGYTSEALHKDGSRSTFVALFSDLAGGAEAKLQQSVDGQHWSDLPNSETTLEASQTEQMWNDDITPRGTAVRIVVGADATGSLEAIKLLSDE